MPIHLECSLYGLYPIGIMEQAVIMSTVENQFNAQNETSGNCAGKVGSKNGGKPAAGAATKSLGPGTKNPAAFPEVTPNRLGAL